MVLSVVSNLYREMATINNLVFFSSLEHMGSLEFLGRLDIRRVLKMGTISKCSGNILHNIPVRVFIIITYVEIYGPEY